MSTKSMAYDHATYLTRMGVALGETTAGATTASCKYAAFTAMIAFSAQLTVTTAGTAAGHGFSICKISGTATTTYAITTIGTAVAGTTTNVLLSTVSGGQTLIQGDILEAVTLVDATGKAAVAYELNAQPTATVTS